MMIPVVDGYGHELDEGDPVTYQGKEYTIQCIIHNEGMPTAVVCLAEGIQTHSYHVNKIIV